MRTALDSSVILDVVTNEVAFADRSEAALRRVSAEGALIIGECVLAEIRPAFKSGEIDAFLADWNIVFEPSTRKSALLAGEMFRAYLDRSRGTTKRVLPDFLIAAHASLSADRLLARDRGYYRDYFKKLRLLEP